MSEDKRIHITKEAAQEETDNPEALNTPSWVTRALLGAGLVMSLGVTGCASKKPEPTTADNPPPRKEAAPEPKPDDPKVPPKANPNPPPNTVRPKPKEPMSVALYSVRDR